MKQDAEEIMVPYIGDYCPYLVEDETTDEEYKIETVNVGFNPECVIS